MALRYSRVLQGYECSEGMSIQECVDHPGDMEFFHTHMQFFSEVDRWALVK